MIAQILPSDASSKTFDSPALDGLALAVADREFHSQQFSKQQSQKALKPRGR